MMPGFRSGRTVLRNVASDWFRAVEEEGNDMGIRYGRVVEETEKVEWAVVSHCECDGIGGFVRVLRGRGVEVRGLPRAAGEVPGVAGSLWRFFRERRSVHGLAVRDDWRWVWPDAGGVPDAVAWHRFSEAETEGIVGESKRLGVTVNSFLLKHLDAAVRGEVRRPELMVPWLVPVNMRGIIREADELGNHVSGIDVHVGRSDTVLAVHRQIRRMLERGEHRANHVMLGMGRFLSHGAKINFLKKAREQPAGNIGSFSNLGVWDGGKEFATRDGWVFCPPVVRGQLLSAGCVTFQGRLGLAMLGRAGVTQGVVEGWLAGWVSGLG